MKRFLSMMLISLSLVVFNQSCKEPEGEKLCSVNGFVTDKISGDPIENADVSLGPAGKKVTTKSDGYYEFGELKPGDYSLSVTKSGYKDYTGEIISLKNSDIISRDIEMERLVSSFSIVDDEGEMIQELNFGNLANDISRAFNIYNDGEIPVHYQIEKTSSWIVNVAPAEGSLQPDSLKRIEVTIDREKLSLGENLTTIKVVSDVMTLELTVKAYYVVNIMTLEPSDITTNSAILKGSINIEDKSLTERGFILHIDESTSMKYVVSGNELGEYSHQVVNLGDGQNYRYEAYMICNDETVYGGEKTFTTLQIPDPDSPAVTTSDVTDVTQNTAVSGGNVTDDGGSSVTARGVCWSTSQNPTVSDNHTTDGNGTGTFTSNLTNLTPSTTYYVRAYATNSEGTSYGEQMTFTTLQMIELPTVTTTFVTDIAQTSATSGGNVTDDGGAEVTLRGVCWSTSQNPTTSDSHTVDGAGTGTFTSNMFNLTPSTTYYVRAYATNSEGTSYGEQMTFTTLQMIELPTVTTTFVTDIAPTSATSGGNVTDDGGAEVILRGVCWSTSQNPTTSDSHTIDGTGTGTFTSNMFNLTPSTTYYVRAYATNSEGTSYGEQKYFTTLSDGMINGHQYVDLGLPSGLKWAKCNVGADNPEDYGNYYAWGETETKVEYIQGNSVTYGQQLSDISGNAQYDAATANWGGSWRMPTRDEIRELIYNCNWALETQNGVEGFKVTGSNGNYIFIPASGYRDGSSLYIYGECHYWSSTPYQYNNDWSYILYSDYEYQSEDVNYRYRGLTIRPVSN